MPQPQFIRHDPYAGAQGIAQAGQALGSAIQRHQQHEHQVRVTNLQQEALGLDMLAQQYGGDITEVARQHPEVVESYLGHVYDGDTAKAASGLEAFQKAPSTANQVVARATDSLARGDTQEMKTIIDEGVQEAEKEHQQRINLEGAGEILRDARRQPADGQQQQPAQTQQPQFTTEERRTDRTPEGFGVMDSPQARREPEPGEVPTIAGREVPSNVEGIERLMEDVSNRIAESDLGEDKEELEHFHSELGKYRDRIERHQQEQQEFEQQPRSSDYLRRQQDLEREIADLKRQREQARGRGEQSRLDAAIQLKEQRSGEARQAYIDSIESPAQAPEAPEAPVAPNIREQAQTSEDVRSLWQQADNLRPLEEVELVKVQLEQSRQNVTENPVEPSSGEDRSYVQALFESGELAPREARRFQRDAAKDRRSVKRDFRVNPEWEGSPERRRDLENSARVLNQMHDPERAAVWDAIEPPEMREAREARWRRQHDRERLDLATRKFEHQVNHNIARFDLDVARFGLEEDRLEMQAHQIWSSMQAGTQELPEQVKWKWDHYSSTLDRLHQNLADKSFEEDWDADRINEELEKLSRTDLYQSALGNVKEISENWLGMPMEVAEVAAQEGGFFHRITGGRVGPGEADQRTGYRPTSLFERQMRAAEADQRATQDGTAEAWMQQRGWR